MVPFHNILIRLVVIALPICSGRLPLSVCHPVCAWLIAQWAMTTGSRLSASHCHGVRRMHPVCHTSSCERAPAVRLPSCLRMAHCYAQKNTPAVIRRSARISQLSTCPSSVPRTAEHADQNRFIFRRIAIIKKAMTSPVVNFVRNPSIERPLFFPQ